MGSVLSIQNGVLKNEQLAQTFGWDKVLGAMAAFSAEVLPTGTVRFTVNQGLYLGELPEGTSTVSRPWVIRWIVQALWRR